ncbi:hypothetical protein HYH03_004410 [Edaphochlamys debaryana]|uniref:Uncharacterized protein n=1 Tax=Edaphochlamys debaryana TaxID=47281 RepID=A0A835Y7E7_9CHLO|nr:hypothetical protein HYH03_004410 [Edaphochlamys debaryana]|eukprot:KAG2497672.1 hypothetical protein HYH03_004410 [Edaphochlamys debaryana]
MLGLKLPQLSDKELRDLEGSFDAVLEGMHSLEDAAVVLERCASQRDIAAALVRLASVAVREDVSDSNELRVKIGTRALMVAGNMLRSVARADPSGVTWAARATASALADALLKTQIFHAAARQAAGVAAALAATTGPQAAAAGAGGAAAGPSGSAPRPAPGAAGAGPGSAACACAADIAGTVADLIDVFCTYSFWRQDKAFAHKLVSALRESCVLDQVGRLLLVLAPAPGAPAPSRNLESRQDTALTSLCNIILEVNGMEQRGGNAGMTSPVPTGMPAAMVLCASVLSFADLLGCGLPRTPLLLTPLSCRPGPRTLPCVQGLNIETLLTTLSRDQQLPRPTVPPRAAIRLLLRVLRLDSASVRASSGSSVSRAPGRVLRVDMGWGNGRRVEAQEYRMLIVPDEASQLALKAMAQLAQAAKARPAAWAAEAAQAWGPLFGAARHAVVKMDYLQRDNFLQYHTYLLEAAVQPLLATLGDLPRMAFSPAQLPAGLKAALEGGFVPLLETALRAGRDHRNNPKAPEVALARAFIVQPLAQSSAALALAHAAPREAAAFIATLSKLLDGIPPVILLQGNDYMTEFSTIIFACKLLQLSLDVLHDTAFTEPPGPLDPAAPCAPLFVLTYATLQLVPRISRMVLAMLAVAEREAARGGRSVLTTPTSAIIACLQALLGAMNYAGTISISPGMLPPHRLAVACSLPLLADDAGLERLLGALLALVRGAGTGPLLLDSFDTDHIVASCCTSLHKALPGRLWGAGSRGDGGIVGHSGADGWQPRALRALASKLAGTEPSVGAELEAVAAKLEGGGSSSPEALQDSGAEAAVAVLAERLAALKVEARALVPACANPACAVHAAAGHKAVCGSKGK